jgi:dihydrofolate reductase
MRKIKLFASSLDGYIARDHGIDWLLTDGDYGLSQFYESIDTIVIDRRTYDEVLEFGKSAKISN